MKDRNDILEIMKEINKRIGNIENQEKLLTSKHEKDMFNQQKITLKECLIIVSKYL